MSKDMPILEDMIGGFAVLVSENDGVSPGNRLRYVRQTHCRHRFFPKRSSPPLVATPLDNHGLKIPDIDKLLPEDAEPRYPPNPLNCRRRASGQLQNDRCSDCQTRQSCRKPTSANFATRGTVWSVGLPQGHIPSGVPAVGPLCDMIKEGKINNAMIIGRAPCSWAV